jgi:formamidopyrimidine-DNA glycosylase
MPELPEVERARKLLEATAVGRRIVRAVAVEDPIVYDGSAPAAVERALRGRRVEAVRRRGKHLWMALDARPWPLFHFGMTGGFTVRGSNVAWPPRFVRLTLRLDDGTEFAFHDARRLGRIRLRRDPETEPPVSELGFDALLDLPPAGDFARALSGRRAAIKALLLDQSFAAGVGNWIADEVLYQARLDPRRPAASLTPDEATRLRSRLSVVVRMAVSVDADSDRFPPHWLFHRRWGRAKDALTAGGERIEFATVGGRTTAFVPAVQR